MQNNDNEIKISHTISNNCISISIKYDNAISLNTLNKIIDCIHVKYNQDKDGIECFISSNNAIILVPLEKATTLLSKNKLRELLQTPNSINLETTNWSKSLFKYI